MTETLLTLLALLAALLAVGAAIWVWLTHRRWERSMTALRHAADQDLRAARAAADEEIARVRATAVRSTEAAVRSVSATLVGMAARTSRKVSEGIRRHEDDDAFETLVGIDHTVQQMLMAGQGWTVLAGGKLTRHWPATSLTDVVRSAMGYVEGYGRVRFQELDVAVRTRVAGPVVHTLAVLLDNALAFSPPQSRVHVSFEQGHHGVIVVVDDSGLQMTPEQLDAARDILTGQRTDDITRLGARPQTGFRVAAALAAAYGFRVDVQAPNSLLGTRALLVLPQELLTELPQAAAPSSADTIPTAPAERDDARAALRTVTAGTRPALASVPLPQAAGDRQAAGSLPESRHRTASGLAVRTRRPATGPAPLVPPANAEPGRASVISSWARGTERARTASDAATDEGHDA
ncbi:ATP-binding protein [Myceligenerans crystallogenes]|uniref:histidine kinase n=1 Tax=Myceligenerans crystallogenes TaxID=316335 RepID=A0ABP4ZIW4_9MICO